MNLQDIRQYIANIIDYDPTTNIEYTKQIDDVINHHYRMLFSEKAFSFAQKEVRLEVYTDDTRTASGLYFAANKLTIVDATLDVPLWIEGNIVEIEGEEYEVLYIDPSVATRFLYRCECTDIYCGDNHLQTKIYSFTSKLCKFATSWQTFVQYISYRCRSFYSVDSIRG